METRTPTWRRLAVPVAFAMGCIVLSIFAFLTFGGSTPLKPEGYRATIPLPQASNLFYNAHVRMAGVNVGKVVEVNRVGNRAEAVVELDSDYAPLRQDARAILRTKTLLGETFIEISPGGSEASFVPEGGSLAASRIVPAQRLDDVLETFEPGTRANLRSLFTGFSRALRGRRQALNNTVGGLEPFAVNLEAVATELDGQRREVRLLISEGGEVLETLGRRQGALQGAIRAGDDVLDATARRNRELAATVRALPPFLRQLRSTSLVLGAASGDLRGAVTALRPAVPLVRPALAAIRETGPNFRSLFNELGPVIAAGNRGAPTLNRMIRAAGPAFSRVYGPFRELIPLVELLSASRTSVVGTFGNVAATLSGRMVGPGNRLIQYGNGLPTVWNETVGGWVKRLPTNRSNAYPKPDSATDIGRIGHLKTYDCRHLGNRLYLPPTGTGAPPCTEQGPWEFKGKTAYFPRLQLAPP